MDAFYIDESAGDDIFVMASVRAPFLRFSLDQCWMMWPEYYRKATEWRRDLSAKHGLRFRKEIHSSDFLAGRGKMHKTDRRLTHEEASEAFSAALASVGFLPSGSILIAAARADSALFGETRMQAAMTALLQRMQRQTEAEDRAALTFFDEGHREYFKAFRKAQAYLPVGSRLGGWGGKATKNKPLSRFVEDGNIKSSEDSYFLQIADMVAHSALQKLKYEAGKLPERRVLLGHHKLFDAIPKSTINLKATAKRSDGIVLI